MAYVCNDAAHVLGYLPQLLKKAAVAADNLPDLLHGRPGGIRKEGKGPLCGGPYALKGGADIVENLDRLVLKGGYLGYCVINKSLSRRNYGRCDIGNSCGHAVDRLCGVGGKGRNKVDLEVVYC